MKRFEVGLRSLKGTRSSRNNEIIFDNLQIGSGISKRGIDSKEMNKTFRNANKLENKINSRRINLFTQIIFPMNFARCSSVLFCERFAICKRE